MSFWVDADKEDIDVDIRMGEINILYQVNNQGNSYVTVKIKDILDLIKEQSC